MVLSSLFQEMSQHNAVECLNSLPARHHLVQDHVITNLEVSQLAPLAPAAFHSAARMLGVY